jgi:hypothetical protein
VTDEVLQVRVPFQSPLARGRGPVLAGQLPLDQALKLLFYIEKEPIKFERAALRWLARYVTEGEAVSLLKAQLALSALAELRAGEREAAAKMLTELVRR